MVLSGETVIVCGCRLTKAPQLMDVCVPATYKPLLTTGRKRERQHPRHCVSLQLLSSDTRLIVHLNTTAVSAAWQPAGSPCRPCPSAFHHHNSSSWTAWTCQQPRQPPRKWQILYRTSNAFLENFELVLLCLQFPSSLFVGGGRPFVSREKQRFTASFKPNLSF